MPTSIATIDGDDLISGSRTDINNNFASLNTNKIETSVIDTDNTLSANSDLKIPSQKAVKAYADTQGNVDANETRKGIVEEATDAEVAAGTATGATGAKLFITPAKLATYIPTVIKIIRTYPAGLPLTTNQTVYLATDGKVYPTNALIAGMTDTFCGFSLGNYDIGETATIQLTGVKSGLSLTIGSNYYLKDATETGDQSVSDGNYSSAVGNLWQSFTTGVGITNLSHIHVHAPGSIDGATFNIYEGEGVGGTLLYTGTVSGSDLNFTSPILVSAGAKYTWQIMDVTLFRSSGNVYAGGTSSGSSYDFGFTTYYYSATGLLDISAGTVSKKVGLAISATELLIN